MNDDEELQRELTRAALHALEGRAFALAGSGAIREHGMVDRLTHDVDLFTNDLDPVAFESAIDTLTDGLRAAGYDVDEVRRVEQFAQLRVTTAEGRTVDMDLAVDWREYEPVTLSIGPVLSVEDAVGNKVSALYTRNEARDFIDVDSIRLTGRFTDAELMSAAMERDAGFEVSMFAQQLDRIQSIAPRRFEEYGVDRAQLDALKERFTQWVAELRTPAPEIVKPAIAGQLDPELQRIMDLRAASFPTSATEIRRPSAAPEMSSYRPPAHGRERGREPGR